MKFTTAASRSSLLILEHADLVKLITPVVLENMGRSNLDGCQVEFVFSNVEEGSPSYKTNKGKCTVKITEDLDKDS